MLRNELGEQLEFSVEVSKAGANKTSVSTPKTNNTTTVDDKKQNKLKTRHQEIVSAHYQVNALRTSHVERYATATNCVLSYPSSSKTTSVPRKYPRDCAWFFKLREKPDSHGARSNLNFFECTSVVKIFHKDSTCTFTDEFFLSKTPGLVSVLANNNQAKTYPGIITNPTLIESIIAKNAYLVKNDLLTKCFDENELQNLKPCMHKDSFVRVLKYSEKKKSEYYLCVNNRLPCWVNDQLRHVVTNETVNRNYEELLKSKELINAKRVATVAQEKIIQNVCDYLDVDVRASEPACHTFTNVLKASTVPKKLGGGDRKKCATFAAGCVFTDDWTRGCVIKIEESSLKGFLHVNGPNNNTDVHGTGWYNDFGDTVPGCLYASKKKTLELLKTVGWDQSWGFRYLETVG